MAVTPKCFYRGALNPGNTVLYTVPAGRSAIVTEILVRAIDGAAGSDYIDAHVVFAGVEARVYRSIFGVADNESGTALNPAGDLNPPVRIKQVLAAGETISANAVTSHAGTSPQNHGVISISGVEITP